jgi:cell pole-organizing protein PopZ
MQDAAEAKERMEEALASIRGIMAEGRDSDPLVPSVPRTSDEEAEDGGLLSRDAAASISSAVDKLTATIKNHQPSLEDVVRDALRPMLKSWLDENLPDVVDRIVRAEIERVIRGR